MHTFQQLAEEPGFWAVSSKDFLATRFWEGLGYERGYHPNIFSANSYDEEIVFTVKPGPYNLTVDFLQGVHHNVKTAGIPREWARHPLNAHPAELAREVLNSFLFRTVNSGRNLSGWDPEMFVVHGDGSLFPAFEFLPSRNAARFGSEANPRTYWDGFQAEFATSPVGCHQYGFNYLQKGLDNIFQAARRKDPKARLTLQNVFEIPTPMMLAAPKEGVELGCKPSNNAYNTSPFAVDDPLMFPLRVAGGHVHFAFHQGMPTTDDFRRKVAKCMDFFLTIPTVGLFAEIDDPQRRQFYGRAGEFRSPAYGIEYRTLSNAWLGCPQVGHIVMELARLAVGLAILPFNLADFHLADEDVRDIIDQCDVAAARSVFEKNLPSWQSALERFGHFKDFRKMVMEGVESVYPNYRNVEANWRLDTNNWEGLRHQWNNFNPKQYSAPAKGY